MFEERDKDIRNYRKAIYYDGIHRYENGVKRDKSVGELTPREMDHVCYEASFSANKQLLNVIMPYFKEISNQNKGLFSVVDNLLEDNRDIYKQLESIKTRLTGEMETR
ncbi:hypothetical protein OYT88_02220 [Sporolactobacillus sp. CQH2019]|uniref:hypothetical protein n=1 Tax=Sporolactobacillus sp. CQH2019 TaxID=3023512 RepID=UPI002368E84D|nr:hypothetical protein [Sporolactobacillus sp. CQH2019]MDD9147365.1 hypothetical protein [Sporolactobacillus sp. CQH2019]